jgi:hypothetical protein
MPKAVLDSWFDDRRRWLTARGLDPANAQWREILTKTDPQEAKTFLDTFWNRWHDALDECHGECMLRRPALAKIVAKSLHHFDNNRYLLLDFVVMPNHVHVLVAFPDEEAMLDQCESWKHYTATQINRELRARAGFGSKMGSITCSAVRNNSSICADILPPIQAERG